MTAAGVGLTLTAATTVIFAELHWTPGVLAQAEDRTHRIGQVNSVNVVYCVCKERELSVDLSLWAMIGRKVNNLGRMIDGEKNASMNANDVENSAEELASFFAENNPNQKVANENTAAPVKGSIQSFFVSKPNPTSTQDKKQVCNNIENTTKVQILKPITSSSPVQSAAVDNSWTCEKCTFINEKNQFNMSCEMCGNTRKRQVTPCLNEKHSPMSSSSVECETPTEIIDLSQSNDCRNTTESASSSTAKSIQTDIIMEHKNSLIQFKVSANSGRIAIFSIDGVSLNFNFDVDEVITQATGEILEKYVRRTITQQRQGIASADVKFDDKSVNDGESSQ